MSTRRVSSCWRQVESRSRTSAIDDRISRPSPDRVGPESSMREHRRGERLAWYRGLTTLGSWRHLFLVLLSHLTLVENVSLQHPSSSLSSSGSRGA